MVAIVASSIFSLGTTPLNRGIPISWPVHIGGVLHSYRMLYTANDVHSDSRTACLRVASGLCCRAFVFCQTGAAFLGNGNAGLCLQERRRSFVLWHADHTVKKACS